ncbi:MAG: hypothetical protein IJ711_05255, partial [Lachnospiraceae bacterium]|nr:hypothetical protein [Lachnospiraceae bacterium]
YEYAPFGDLIKGSYGQILFLYNGQYGVMSDDNGLYYMRARYYNVSIKRFINQDVLTGEISESQSLNRYAYVEGNPVTYFDPFGLDRFDTSYLHKNIAGASIAIGLIVLGAITFGAASAALIVTATIVSAGLSATDFIAYNYDARVARTYDELVDARVGEVNSVISFFLSFADVPLVGGNSDFANVSVGLTYSIFSNF